MGILLTELGWVLQYKMAHINLDQSKLITIYFAKYVSRTRPVLAMIPIKEQDSLCPVTTIRRFVNKLLQYVLSFDGVCIRLLHIHDLMVCLEGVTSYFGPKLGKRCCVLSKYVGCFGMYVRPRVFYLWRLH